MNRNLRVAAKPLQPLKLEMGITKGSILYSVISGGLTFVVVRFLIVLTSQGFAFSLVPGWHTPIIPPAITLNEIAIFVLIISLVVCLIFLGIRWVLVFIGTRLI